MDSTGENSTIRIRLTDAVSHLELSVAPEMTLLDAKSTGLSPEKTREQLTQGLNQYGNKLQGIILSDDSLVSVVRGTLVEHDRKEVVVVSQGTSQRGINAIKSGAGEIRLLFLCRKDVYLGGLFGIHKLQFAFRRCSGLNSLNDSDNRKYGANGEERWFSVNVVGFLAWCCVWQEYFHWVPRRRRRMWYW